MDDEADSDLLGCVSENKQLQVEGLVLNEPHLLDVSETEFQEVDIEGNTIHHVDENDQQIVHEGVLQNVEEFYDLDQKAEQLYKYTDHEKSFLDEKGCQQKNLEDNIGNHLTEENSDFQEFAGNYNNVKLISEPFQDVPDIFSLLNFSPCAVEDNSDFKESEDSNEPFIPESSAYVQCISNIELSNSNNNTLLKSLDAFAAEIPDCQFSISKSNGEEIPQDNSLFILNENLNSLYCNNLLESGELYVPDLTEKLIFPISSTAANDAPISPDSSTAFDNHDIENVRRNSASDSNVLSLSALGFGDDFQLSDDAIAVDESMKQISTPRKRNREKSDEENDSSYREISLPYKIRRQKLNQKYVQKNETELDCDESIEESIEESLYVPNSDDFEESEDDDLSISDKTQTKQKKYRKDYASQLSPKKRQNKDSRFLLENTQDEALCSSPVKIQDEISHLSPEKTHDEQNTSQACTSKQNSEQTTKNKSKQNVNSIQKMRNIPIQQKVASSSEGSKWYDDKKNFCKYCLTKVSRIDRHLLFNHIKEKDVLEASLERPGSKLRRELLGRIRMEGNDLYNSDRTINPEGEIICARRLQVKKSDKENNQPKVNEGDEPNKIENLKKDLNTQVDKALLNLKGSEVNPPSLTKPKQVFPLRVICPYCPGYYSVNTLRNHIGLMHNTSSDGNLRNQLALSKRAMGLCHERASESVRKFILPPLKTDAVGRAARYDLLIILYANKYVIRHSKLDQQGYVRGHMRLLAKLLLALKKLNSRIPDLATVFRPLYWPTVSLAINMVCELDQDKNRFAIIYNAETLPILIRKCIKILKFEYTIKEDKEKLDYVEAFEKVFTNEAEISISYIAFISRKEAGRHKDAPKLPESDDVLCFENYLILKRNVSLKHFEAGGREFSHYLNITQTTAVLILLYNRRRVGEISKTLLEDYLHAKRANPDSEFFQMLSEEEQAQRLKYTRIDIHGKRIDGKGSLYLCENNEKCVSLLVKYRSLFISKDNEYLFALPNGPDGQSRHIKVCELMSKLSKECSIKFREIDDGTMRGTVLRKQLATINDIIGKGKSGALISNHMGHSKKVHDKYYKQTIDSDDVAVTKLLDGVQTGNFKKNKEIETSTLTQNSECSNFSDTLSSPDETMSDAEVKVTKEKDYGRRVPSTSLNKVKAKVNRRSWSNEELYAFEKGFKSCIQTRRYPTATEIRSVKEKYKVLNARSENVIRVRFSNLFKAHQNKKIRDYEDL